MESSVKGKQEVREWRRDGEHGGQRKEVEMEKRGKEPEK